MNLGGFRCLKLTAEDNGRVILLEFDHGKANEVGTPVLEDLERLVSVMTDQDGPVALISVSKRRSSRGTALFVAGADVKERTDWNNNRVKEHVRWQRYVLSSLRRAPVFHVCVVGGVALGWGTEFLLTSDYRIASDEAVFGLPETGLGILPGAGGTSELWSQIGMPHALRLGMTGERIDADEAARIGLVQERYPSIDEGINRARALCDMVARRSPTALSVFKRAMLDSAGHDLEHRCELEARAYEHCVDTGQAALGRAQFDRIRKGETPDWGTRR